MMAIITTHYQYALFSQVYKIAFSFNFLGSPVNFVSTLGTGVYDFFHEPLAGIVKSPQDFGAGVVKGSKSLVKVLIKILIEYSIFSQL